MLILPLHVRIEGPAKAPAYRQRGERQEHRPGKCRARKRLDSRYLGIHGPICRDGRKTDARILGEGEHPRAATGEQKDDACNRSPGKCQKPKMGSHANRK